MKKLDLGRPFGISFLVPGSPVGKERARVVHREGQKPRAFTPRKTEHYEARVKACAWEAMQQSGVRALPTGPLFVRVLVRPEGVEVTVSEADPGFESGTPDLDNVFKTVADAMNGVVYQDDRQVAQIQAGRLK